MNIHDKLPLFCKEDILYRQLIGDPNRPELLPITNINDRNEGAIANALGWHLNYQQRIVNESSLLNATGHNLDIWGDFYGLPRPAGYSDADYVQFIIGTVTAAIASVPVIFRLFPDPPDAYKYTCYQRGVFCDYSFLDTSIINPTHNLKVDMSSVLISMSHAVYVLVPDITTITNGLISRLYSAVAAGTGVYIGEFPTP